MARKQFSYLEPHFCRVMMVKDAPILTTVPLTGPARVAAIIEEKTRDLGKESVWSIPLDSRRRPLAYVMVSLGTLTQSLAHPRELLQPVLLGAGAAFIICHNHPSGDPTPSPDDHALTRRAREASEIMGIPLVDHVIVGLEGKFYSYADNGWPV